MSPLTEGAGAPLHSCPPMGGQGMYPVAMIRCGQHVMRATGHACGRSQYPAGSPPSRGARTA
ncbi:hypothetical protein [Komagataeibacter sp. FNDCF1]|uniref:hypothetical protein n=1 Tax=Komagataeibacter sp. FNDCF1 TaxID=2878681 RepID=UPI001E578E8D|nr:hypothetical protein [Komagataeibacter sp. FNDCF1]MCE2565227.1 hypothetical protein [Komagataeibacter sp. FNDCF1]